MRAVRNSDRTEASASRDSQHGNVARRGRGAADNGRQDRTHRTGRDRAISIPRAASARQPERQYGSGPHHADDHPQATAAERMSGIAVARGRMPVGVLRVARLLREPVHEENAHHDHADREHARRESGVHHYVTG